MEIPYTQHTLPNGLDVLVHEDHGCPIVAVNVWYRVGSKDECPGRTGFAHLFEHLMFEGSQHYDRGYFHPLQKAGALLNGSTSSERTNYWEVVPTNALDLALWMESDRMGYLLPALTPEKFENQRDVVLNERRQSYENRPYGLAGMVNAAALFPSSHPYSWMTIGHVEDLTDATFNDVQKFCELHYRPNQASLALAGDIDTEHALDLAKHYFAGIPAGSKPPELVLESSPESRIEQRLLLADRVELPRLYLSWVSPAMFDAGDAALDLLADILSTGKSSRLHRALVRDQRIATEVAASQSSRQLSSVFQIIATAAPGHNLTELDAAISVELERLIQFVVSHTELERSRIEFEANFVYSLQHVGGFGGKSDQLNAYNVFTGDPGFITQDLARYQSVTPDSIQRVAARYFGKERRVALSVVPHDHPELALRESERAVVK
jgi:zinc protease